MSLGAAVLGLLLGLGGCVLERVSPRGDDGIWTDCAELTAPGATPRPDDPCDEAGVGETCCITDCTCSEWVERYTCEGGALRREVVGIGETEAELVRKCGAASPSADRCTACPGI